MLSVINEDIRQEYKGNNNKEKYINENFNLKEILNKEVIEYSLNIHIFNPSKNSPPNSWHLRLKNRINSFNNIQELIL